MFGLLSRRVLLRDFSRWPSSLRAFLFLPPPIKCQPLRLSAPRKKTNSLLQSCPHQVSRVFFFSLLLQQLLHVTFTHTDWGGGV